MSYRCGIGPGIPGHDPGPARITCDGCGVKRPVANRSGLPYEWFLDSKPAPGWSLRYEGEPGESPRVDLCPACRRVKA